MAVEIKSEFHVKFGAWLKAARLAAGLTQHQLARYIGARASGISNFETGRRCPSAALLIRYAHVLKLDLTQFPVADTRLIWERVK